MSDNNGEVPKETVEAIVPVEEEPIAAPVEPTAMYEYTIWTFAGPAIYGVEITSPHPDPADVMFKSTLRYGPGRLVDDEALGPQWYIWEKAIVRADQIVAIEKGWGHEDDDDDDDEDEELFHIPPSEPHGKKTGSRTGFTPRVKAKW